MSNPFSPEKRKIPTPKRRNKKIKIKKREKECMIFIDNRESAHIEELRNYLENKYKREKITTKQLSMGDYQIFSPDGQYSFAIELKKAFKKPNYRGEIKVYNDLINSVKDDRIVYQPNEIAENFDDSLLLFQSKENHLDEDLFLEIMPNWDKDSIINSWISIAIRRSPGGRRPQLFIVNTIEQVATVINKVATMIEEDDLTRHSELGRKKLTRKTSMTDPYVMRNVRLNMIASIPGIGTKTARKILNYFNWDLEKLFKASLNELTSCIQDVGKVYGTRLYESLHSMNFST